MILNPARRLSKLVHPERLPQRMSDPDRSSPPDAHEPPRIGSRLPASTFAWVITGINVAIFIGMELTGGSTSARNLIRWGANFAPLVAQGEYWRLLTCAFLHIGLPHLLFNSFALLTFGRLSEAIFGHARFLTIYLVSGITGALLSYFFTRGLSAGASGAIFGVATALAVFYYLNRPAFRVLGENPLGGILVVLAINAVLGVVQPGIDNWGHGGGILGGAALAMWLAPRVVLERDFEGGVVGVRWQPSPPSSWLIVPVVLLIIAAALALSLR
jgi:membrane associated rhomboid family serine protease